MKSIPTRIPTKTSAVPRSGCRKTRKVGTAMSRPATEDRRQAADALAPPGEERAEHHDHEHLADLAELEVEARRR